MTAIKGSQKIIAMGLGDTFGTPVALGTGSKIEVESYSDSENTTELTSNPIGGGVIMQTISERGQVSPTIEINMLAGYNDAGVDAVKQFFGTDTTSSIVAGSAYAHLFTMNETFNTEFLTVADLKTATLAVEYPSCVVTSLNYSLNTNDYMKLAISLLGNLQDLDPATNKKTQLDSATVADATRVVVRPGHEFRINTQAGDALDSDDDLSITMSTMSFTKAMEHVPEVRGADGNSEPESSGIPVEVMLTVERKNQPDLDFMTAHQEGTEYKASLLVEGPVISGTTTYAYEFYFPRLKIVTPVEASASSPGRNPESITFRCLKATANPAGMSSTYPYIRIVNTKATAYKAA